MLFIFDVLHISVTTTVCKYWTSEHVGGRLLEKYTECSPRPSFYF